MSKFGTEITLQLGTAVGTRRGSFWNFQIRDERSGKVLLQFGLTQEEMGKALATQAVTVPATVWTDPRHGQFCETRMVTVPIAKMLTHNGYDQDAMKVEVFLWLALNETKGMVLGEDWIPEIEAEWNTHRFDRDSISLPKGIQEKDAILT